MVMTSEWYSIEVNEKWLEDADHVRDTEVFDYNDNPVGFIGGRLDADKERAAKICDENHMLLKLVHCMGACVRNRCVRCEVFGPKPKTEKTEVRCIVKILIDALEIEVGS